MWNKTDIKYFFNFLDASYRFIVYDHEYSHNFFPKLDLIEGKANWQYRHTMADENWQNS